MEHVESCLRPSCKAGCWLGCAVVLSLSWCSRAKSQGTAIPPNAPSRVLSLKLPQLEGTVPVYYSEGLKDLALRDQAEIADCASWYSKQLHV